jgi:hypothetical protein
MTAHPADSNNIYAGIWRCCYWFPSNNHDGEDISEYYATIHQRGNKLILESLPNIEESYLILRLTLDGDVATGTWQESTSPHGEFKGMVYSGALQLMIDKDHNRMEGKWAGVGKDHELRKARVYTGRWEIVRAGAQAPSEAKA